MAHPNAQVDADFFAMIHQRVTAPEGMGSEMDERRQEKRFPFVGLQWVAAWDGRHFPAAEAFQQVRCHDLSCQGFSFVVPRPLAQPQLVAGFGQRPDLIYVAAEQVWSSHVLLFPSGRVLQIDSPEAAGQRRHPNGEIGRPLLLVGCRFLHRLDVVAP